MHKRIDKKRFVHLTQQIRRDSKKPHHIDMKKKPQPYRYEKRIAHSIVYFVRVQGEVHFSKSVFKSSKYMIFLFVKQASKYMIFLFFLFRLCMYPSQRGPY